MNLHHIWGFILCMFQTYHQVEDHVVTIGPDSVAPSTLSAIEDNQISTCTTFQSQERKATKLRIDVSLGAGSHSIDVVGTGLGCSQSPGGALYMVALTTEQTGTWYGRWETCSVTTKQTQGSKENCRFLCFCKETCPQLQLYHRPHPQDTTDLTLCVIEQRYIPDSHRDCQDIKDKGFSKSGVYDVVLDGGVTSVLCNMTADGGGWTVLMSRRDGSVNFVGNWLTYKNGFGDLSSEFWLGNEKMHQLTSDGRNYILSVEGILVDGNQCSAHYNHFVIGDESSKYLFDYGAYIGGSDDAFWSHKGKKFSTSDQDNDNHEAHCATYYSGSWWYDGCYSVHLTGLYGTTHGGAEWSGGKVLKYVDMKIRPA